jgi:UDP-glucose-4-epimerase GalE
VPESVAHPERYYRNNIAAVIELLEGMRKHGVKTIVFSSSCATYGDPRYSPMDEAHPQQPVSPYGESKRVCERMLDAYREAHGFSFASLRYFNASGADPMARIGESHDPETHLIPIVLQVATERRPHVTIFGDDYDTPDGTCIRDYVHVDDLALAHGLALDRLRSGGESAFLNLGSETGHSVRDVIETCREVTGRPIAATAGARRPGDPPRLVASASRARAELGWTPSHTELTDIVRTAWQWERNRRY